MFFGIDANARYIGILIIFEIRDLMKPITTNFPSAGTLRMGNGNGKTSMLFRNIEAWNTYNHQIQLKYDGDDLKTLEYLFEFHDLPFEKLKRSEKRKGCDYL